MNPTVPRHPPPPSPLVYLNGRFTPESEATVSALDRGFLYGDGLFETVRVYQGRLVHGDAHLARLARGAAQLRLLPPLANDAFPEVIRHLLRLNHLEDAIVRINLSRGRGPRGYSPRGAGPPTLVIAAFPAPPLHAPPPAAWRLHTSTYRLPPGDPLTPVKSTNRLLHVLARAEAEDLGLDEALLLNSRGEVTELASANVFWIANDRVLTPALATGALAGVTRAAVLDLLAARAWPHAETVAPLPDLLQADAAFATLSTHGIVPLISIDGHPLGDNPRLADLRQAYLQSLQRLLSD